MSERSNKVETSIRPSGSYYDIDDEGYLINPTSYEKIQPHWLPVIDRAVEAYQQICGDDLTHVFIRGSVAKGEATDGISDLDTFAYIDTKGAVYQGFREYTEAIVSDYPFSDGVEFSTYHESEGPGDNLIVQSLCVYGTPPEQPKLKPGKVMIRNARGVFNRMKRSEEICDVLRGTDRYDAMRDQCVWLMKEMLRVGIELTYERSGRFTRDLYLCWKDFSEYYPEHEATMHEALYLALNPTAELARIEGLRGKLAPFLQSEALRLGIDQV
jgi:hypothetical protein